MPRGGTRECHVERGGRTIVHGLRDAGDLLMHLARAQLFVAFVLVLRLDVALRLLLAVLDLRAARRLHRVARGVIPLQLGAQLRRPLRVARGLRLLDLSCELGLLGRLVLPGVVNTGGDTSKMKGFSPNVPGIHVIIHVLLGIILWSTNTGAQVLYLPPQCSA